MTDQVGAFWLVMQPGKDSVLEDILCHCDLEGFSMLVLGGLKFKSVIGVFTDGAQAEFIAKEVLRTRDTLGEKLGMEAK